MTNRDGRLVCRHGNPVQYEIAPPEWMPDHTLRYTAKTTICEGCIADGTHDVILRIIDGVLRRAHGESPPPADTGQSCNNS